MKKFMMIAAITVVMFATPLVYAEDAHHPDQKKQAQATSSSMPNKAISTQMEKMKENMKEMQAQMEKIHQTTDPSERQKLMQEHMKSMREQMKMMHSMEGDMMMKGDANMRQKMMGERMDMMQMMMEQMMQHQEAMQSMPK